MNDSLVSVIVPTKNSSRTIEACLKSVKDQSYKNVEIIVVDNDSIDNTKEIARKYTDKVFDCSPERSAQRNFGVRMSAGEYVAIIDSDMELTSKVVDECVQAILNDDVVGVVIPEESFGIGFWAQCKRLERSFYVGVSWMEAARFFRRETYLSLGGYDESITSVEDWDLSQRIGDLGKLENISSFILHNEGHPRLINMLRKKKYYASHFANYAKYAMNDKKRKQMSIISRYGLFFSKPIKLFHNPFLGIGMLFMKTCEFGAIAFALITSKR